GWSPWGRILVPAGKNSTSVRFASRSSAAGSSPLKGSRDPRHSAMSCILRSAGQGRRGLLGGRPDRDDPVEAHHREDAEDLLARSSDSQWLGALLVVLCLTTEAQR